MSSLFFRNKLAQSIEMASRLPRDRCIPMSNPGTDHLDLDHADCGVPRSNCPCLASIPSAILFATSNKALPLESDRSSEVRQLVGAVESLPLLPVMRTEHSCAGSSGTTVQIVTNPGKADRRRNKAQEFAARRPGGDPRGFRCGCCIRLNDETPLLRRGRQFTVENRGLRFHQRLPDCEVQGLGSEVISDCVIPRQLFPWR